MPERPLLHLVDGSGYIFRAYYAIRPLSTSTGVPTNAVTGVARMLLRLIKEEKPEWLAVAFDTEHDNFRHGLLDSYKANRQEPPEDLSPQFALVHELVQAMGIALVAVPGFEADDVIATLAHQAVERGHEVIVVSGDKDLMQLVSPHVTMYDPMKEKRYDRQGVIERFGVPPELVADVQALAGDSSDNIPGVPRVGLKTAARLVAQHGDVENVIAALAGAGKLKAAEQAVVDHADSARLSKRLTTLALDAPVSFDAAAWRYSGPVVEALAPFLRRMEAFTLLRELGTVGDAADGGGLEAVAVAPADAPAPSLPESMAAAAPAAGDPVGGLYAVQPSPIDRSVYRTILSEAELDEELRAARAAGRLSVDLETTSLDPNRAEIVGVALCVPGRSAAYVPVAHRYLGVPRQLGREQVLGHMRDLLEDEALAKIGQNLKYDQVVLARAGVTLRGVRHDSMLAAWVLDPSRASCGLDTLAREVLGHETIRYHDVTGQGKKQLGFDEVAVDVATRYAAEDADVALRLCEAMEPRLREAGLGPLYSDLELPLVGVLADMERAGVRVDTAHLRRLGQELGMRLNAVEAQAHELIGSPINLGSPRQLATLFFDKLGYPPVKKTKTGYSTDQEVLEILAKSYELPRVILEHRLLAKLKSTYVDALPKMVNPQTGRVHTSFNQTGTATGRLSSSDPNLQNIPARSEDGRRIRAAFAAADGWEIISADYSQIELRVMAHLSRDEHFLAAFARGEDIHRRTAREVLTDGAEPTSEQRRQAKAINFGILYGLSEFGLSRQLGISRGDAGAFIGLYFGRYPRIREFLERTIAEARQCGYVSTIAGRRRFLPELQSRNGNVRQAAERVAMNTPIQGSAADLIKVAMLRVHALLRRRRLRARLLLQVHDELVLEAPIEERDEVIELVRAEMSQVRELSVPLVVDVGHGPHWAAAH